MAYLGKSSRQHAFVSIWTALTETGDYKNKKPDKKENRRVGFVGVSSINKETACLKQDAVGDRSVKVPTRTHMLTYIHKYIYIYMPVPDVLLWFSMFSSAHFPFTRPQLLMLWF